MSNTAPRPDVVVEFFVSGVPEPQGNKTGFAVRSKKTGKTRVVLREGRTEDARDRFKAWRAACSEAAGSAHSGRVIESAVHVDTVFAFPRPASHYRKGLLTTKAREAAKVSAPDLDKLERAVFDSLKNVVLVDDSRIVGGTPRKRYVMPGESPGVHVRIQAACCCGLPKYQCPTHGIVTP